MNNTVLTIEREVVNAALVAAGRNLLEHSRAAAVHLPIGEGMSVYLGIDAEIATMVEPAAPVAASQASIGDDACSPLQFLHNVCADVFPALRNSGHLTLVSLLEVALKELSAPDSRASAAPVTAIAPDSDLAQARRAITDIRRHVDESKNSHLWILIDDDIEFLSKYLAAPQQEGSEAGK
jgi:hypothetical protein